MNKKIHLLIIILLAMSLISFIRDDKKLIENSDSRTAIDSRKLDVNNISTWYRNNGSFNRNPITGNAGFEWPKGESKFARHVSGLWIGAKVGNDTLLAIAEFDYEYLPGYVDNNGNPQGSTDPLYRIYSIDRDDTLSPDYLNWPVSQGAYINSMGKPFFLGTQTMFYSYTDGYPEVHGNRAGHTAPLKAQILQTNWSYSNVGLQDVCFTEFRIINRSSSIWENCFIAVWSDDDIGVGWDDTIGFDTIRSLVYTYNFDNFDEQYGKNPPAVGYKIVRGPVNYSIGDTFKYYSPPGSNNLILKSNFREEKISTFNPFINSDPGYGDPSNSTESYLCLQGYRRNGNPWINPQTNQETKIAFPGDPETGQGWFNTQNNGFQRFMIAFGPLNTLPNDTQSIIIAQVIARGSSNLNSITKLRELSDHVQSVYDNNFQDVLSVKNISDEIPIEFNLHQNFPNPFNPKTIIHYEISSENPHFGKGGAGGVVSLKVYDVLGNEVAELVSEKQNAGNYKVEFDGSGFSSGVYFYKLTAGNFSETKRMVLLK